MKVQIIRHLLTVSDYHLMQEVGILSEDDHVELINGEIIKMSPKGSKHSGIIGKLSEIIFDQIRGKAHLRLQDPIQLGNHSEPEPDLAIVQRKNDFYTSGHPTPQEIFLLIEVADSSLQIDREIKLPIYASFGIPEVWIINLVDKVIEVYNQPIGDNYSNHFNIKGDLEAKLESLGIKLDSQALFF